MAQLMADILSEWREAERLLAELPPLSPHLGAVRQVIDSLRTTYARLADSQELSQDDLESNRLVLHQAQSLLESVEPRLSRSSPGAQPIGGQV